MAGAAASGISEVASALPLVINRVPAPNCAHTQQVSLHRLQHRRCIQLVRQPGGGSQLAALLQCRQRRRVRMGRRVQKVQQAHRRCQAAARKGGRQIDGSLQDWREEGGA